MIQRTDLSNILDIKQNLVIVVAHNYHNITHEELRELFSKLKVAVWWAVNDTCHYL